MFACILPQSCPVEMAANETALQLERVTCWNERGFVTDSSESPWYATHGSRTTCDGRHLYVWWRGR